jgi:hypothetical protein
LVAYACKGRCICPSCVARRMADCAAHLVEHVLPWAPYRQWTLSLPYAVRFRVGYDIRLLSAVLRVFLRTVFAWQRRKARAPPQQELDLLDLDECEIVAAEVP